MSESRLEPASLAASRRDSENGLNRSERASLWYSAISGDRRETVAASAGCRHCVWGGKRAAGVTPSPPQPPPSQGGEFLRFVHAILTPPLAKGGWGGWELATGAARRKRRDRSATVTTRLASQPGNSEIAQHQNAPPRFEPRPKNRRLERASRWPLDDLAGNAFDEET